MLTREKKGKYTKHKLVFIYTVFQLIFIVKEHFNNEKKVVFFHFFSFWFKTEKEKGSHIKYERKALILIWLGAIIKPTRFITFNQFFHTLVLNRCIGRN